MWATCRRLWESSWGLLCSPCSWHSKHPTTKQNQEVLPACVGARFKATQARTPENWNIPFVVVLSIPAWHDCQNSWALQVELSLFFVAPDVPTHFAGDSWCYPSILHLSLLRHQTTNNENQKDFFLFPEDWAEESCFPMPFIQKEGTKTVMLNCSIWDWSLLAQMGEAH